MRDGGRGSETAPDADREPVILPRKNPSKGDLGLPMLPWGSMETFTCNLAPNSKEEEPWLAHEVSASIQFVAGAQRRGARVGLERSDPGKVASVLVELARGMSQSRARSQFKLSGKVVSRLVRDHQELLERTHAWRAETGARLAVKASRAFEEKLDRILDDPETLDRTPMRDFALAYRVTLDQQRTALAACPTPTRTSRLTLEDARKAIKDAKRRIHNLS